ncbi:unnamed protein product, partial [Brachionus calyciflorus]
YHLSALSTALDLNIYIYSEMRNVEAENVHDLLNLFNERTSNLCHAIIYKPINNSTTKSFGFLAQVVQNTNTEWNYKENGPDAWPFLFNGCKGEEQSPINIIINDLIHKPSLNPIIFNNYDKIYKWNLTHNGHTIISTPLYDSSSKAFINGSDFSEKFELIQFHFHWGYNMYQGSEHLIDFLKFPLEIHFVHQSSKTGQLAVLGFLFQPTDEKISNPLFDDISSINTTEMFQLVEYSVNSIVSISNKENLTSYFRYDGSLTTPPCSENVIWTVFDFKPKISISHIKRAFYSNWPMLNFREPQKTNKRNIYSSVCMNKYCTSTASERNSLSLYLLIVIGFYY